MNPIHSALDADSRRDAADQFSALAVEYLEATRDPTSRVSTNLASAQIAARFDEPVPRTGNPLEAVIARLRHDVIADANRLYHPRAMGHQVSAPLPAAIWSESLIAALNQSVAVAEMSPTATVMEHRVVQW